MNEYKHRIADEILAKKIKSKGAVLIEGPKWCGKTTTAEQAAASILYLDEPQKLKQNIFLADTNPELLLEGETPRLIDEWQIAPKLWDTVRFSVDHRRSFGQFILTGSAVPAKTDEIHHSGTGRFSWLRMRTMSLFESGESSGDISLSALFDKQVWKHGSVIGKSSLTIYEIAFLICRGGWPMSLCDDKEIALLQGIDYYDAIVNEDISRVDGVKKDRNYIKRLMRSYARNQGTQVSINSLIKDLNNNEDPDPSGKTISSYLKALKKIFVIEDVEAWNPNLRSKTAIRTADTRYFTDSSIACAALGLGPDDLLHDIGTMGLLFETMAIRDLRVYADYFGASVYHYRDGSGLECDAVIHCRNGSYGLIEIKLGSDDGIEAGCHVLKKLSEKIDTENMKEPSFSMVLTAVGNLAYRREDGIFVVPIGCLRN